MAALAQKRCLNHDDREAVCRCPSCANFFCRECVVLFESRLLCANCLHGDSALPFAPGKKLFGFSGFSLALLGFLVTWALFFFAAWALLQFREHSVQLPALLLNRLSV
jgi:hypothetical protein